MACNKQLVPCDTTAMSANYELVSWPLTSQPRIRTNIVLLKPHSFYIPEDDDSVPYAFMLGRHTISTAGGGCEEALLSGYFSTLCAVLPDLTNIANKVMKNLGFQVEEIAVRSQADRMNNGIPQSQNLKLEIIKFAQMCLLPFQIRFDSDINIFWGEVAKDAGVVVADDSSLMMCSVDGMKLWTLLWRSANQKNCEAAWLPRTMNLFLMHHCLADVRFQMPRAMNRLFSLATSLPSVKFYQIWFDATKKIICKFLGTKWRR